MKQILKCICCHRESEAELSKVDASMLQTSAVKKVFPWAKEADGKMAYLCDQCAHKIDAGEALIFLPKNFPMKSIFQNIADHPMFRRKS